MYACAQNNDGVHDFPSPRATTRPPRRISAPIPPDSRRKIGFLLKFSAFSRDFAGKYALSAPKCDATQKQKQRPCPPTYRTTAIPTISRISAYHPVAPNCSAKATAAVHTCTQNDSRTRNFPYPCAVTQPPTAHFHSNPARFPPKIPAFAEISGFSRNFAEKCAPSTSEHIAAQNQRLPGRAHLRAERQPHPQFPIPLCCHPAARSTFPPDSRRKFRLSLKNSAFRAILPKKLRTVRPKMRRNSKAKAAAMPTHIQADSRTRNFPHLRVPPSRSQLQRKSNRSRAHLRAEQRSRP